ncbi:efflux RND transporter periplasmic adaptor subunit [Shewanella sp. D64]|uniref:efflux RND transporter periplasmic adaptor subunit n=1 Tax=unclassified Shewanella TaxID=196818 RepID=UPI0022BA677F|nr:MULTISPECIES: efflux RND transporter periplasmic adaptor subunit [unclassified Shewanella]MEC4726900.1 efflux RND transporter periplasmic adaptor subunit [Shewanella sp. D64]MEC4738603.1 efflux RND transporter periplasmic adaptor subunit [Shewanella sp. E94]WBJ93820.1 efflux RND transporter periplasmic adaptor subunit [Shewanella sp. MTB7]
MLGKRNNMMLVGLCICAPLLFTGCGDNTSSEIAPYVKSANVATINAHLTEVTLYDELQGRVRPLRTAEIRPQVSGIISARLFKQGDSLEKGEALFQIEQDAFKIDLEIKQASLAQSQANLGLIQSQLDRMTQLERTDAVSQQDFEEASFNQQIAVATVQQNRAQLAFSQLQLEYAKVTAPIAGFIGEAMVTEGALVSRTDAKPLAIIQQIDQVYIDVRQPASKLSQLRGLLDKQPQGSDSALAVIVQYSSNRDEDIDGKILFSGISVDENTGDLIVRILANNPQRALLPGMYVRTQIPRGQLHAFKVPEHAVQRSSTGDPFVYVVKGDTFEKKQVELEGIQHRQYIISKGLNQGDLVVVTGQDNLQSGVALTLSDWQQTKY